jgi:hypothetical protein
MKLLLRAIIPQGVSIIFAYDEVHEQWERKGAQVRKQRFDAFIRNIRLLEGRGVESVVR